MNKMEISCNRANYGGTREEIRYIVVHYTAGNGDTARENGIYFQNTRVGASAHWFVDETTAVSSVPEQFAAWHCGGTSYIHPECRNVNSIGVELCSRRKQDGTYFFLPETVVNAAALVRALMKKYRVPEERVLRHYDVTGKKCPAPFLDAGQWEEFQRMLQRYDRPEDIPAWGRDTVEKLTERKILQGDGQKLDLSRDMLRVLVMLDRAGNFE